MIFDHPNDQRVRLGMAVYNIRSIDFLGTSNNQTNFLKTYKQFQIFLKDFSSYF